MSKATFHHKCTECEHQYNVETYWIDPSLYSDPEKARKTLSFWCKNTYCGRGQAVILQLLPENKIDIYEKLDYRSLIREDSYSYYDNKKDDYDNDDSKITERLTEEAALSVISKMNIT